MNAAEGTIVSAGAGLALGAHANTYRRLAKRRICFLLGALAVVCVCLGIDLSIGPEHISAADLLSAMLRPGSLGRLNVVVWEIRLPIALMAVLVGASLGIAGATMQTILNNPLAEPYTLGVSSSAGFGAALAIVLGFDVLPIAGSILIAANAFIFALLTCVLLLVFTRIRGATVETMILVGIALMFTFNAFLGLLEYRASEVELQQVVFWMMGSLARSSWPKIAVSGGLLLVIVPWLMHRSWALTALRMGEERATALGVDVRRLRIEMLICIALLAATSVAFVGTIGFVGLVGPHMARLTVGEDQRYFLPGSALAGAFLLSSASIVSKCVVPGVLYPLGIVTTLVGIPFFLSLVISIRKGGLQG